MEKEIMAAKYSDDVYTYDLYRCQEVTGSEAVQFIGHLSYGLYQLACDRDIIGDETVIRIRRQMTELHTEFGVIESNILDDKFYVDFSGSKGEGFRFSSDDSDFMFIYRHVKVVNSLTDHHQYDDNTTVLLMESSKSPPGYVLMRLVGNAYDSDVLRSCAPYLSHTYVSSQIWRDENPYKVKSASIHGPCNSGVVGMTEYHHAYCLHSDTWPALAYGCIRRLLSRQWPSLEVVKDIITGGVDFVPISSKISKHEFYEWRISFSVAEKRLIHSMNHTQFMCYGLLKIFLKEAINNVEEIKSVLCSYHLKTAVFWEILNPSTKWEPNALLCCFWKCFRKLIAWTDNEYLPNFFIPENNMLVGKFQSCEKKILMDHLNMLHSEGYSCLLRCQSLNDVLIGVIHRPLTAYTLDYHCADCKTCWYEVEKIAEVSNYEPRLTITVPNQRIKLQALTHLCNPHFVEQAISIWWRKNMEHLAKLYDCVTLLFDSHKRNKEIYQKTKTVLNVINRCRTDCANHYVYIAVCLYRWERHEDVINAIRKSKIKLQNQFLMYIHIPDIDRYKAAGGVHTPFPLIMRKCMTRRISLNYSTGIPELKLEHQVIREQYADIMPFPPLVIAELLHCLSCYHLGYHQLARESVSDLYTLVHYDENYHIHKSDRAISWQILGICQEMTCDYAGAYQSYYNALHEQYSLIRPASRRRLEHLCSTYI